MKIKCPSCEKTYRTHDAVLTHLGQTGCLDDKNITKKLLNSLDFTLKDKIIKHKLKKIKDDIYSLAFCIEYHADDENRKRYSKSIINRAKNNYRVLNGFILEKMEKEDD